MANILELALEWLQSHINKIGKEKSARVAFREELTKFKDKIFNTFSLILI